MDFDGARAAIETRFAQEWRENGAFRTRVGWTDQAFEPPRDEASVRITVREGDSGNASIGTPGANVVRYAGAVMFTVFTPAGQGSAEANRLIGQIIDIFANWRTDELLVRPLRQGAIDTQPPLRRASFFFPYERDIYHG